MLRGRLDPLRQVHGQDGVEKYTTDIIADEMQMLGGKPEGNRQRQSAPNPKPQPAQDYYDDDINF